MNNERYSSNVSDDRVRYAYLKKYNPAPCGKGVIAPPFMNYKFGTSFQKEVKPVFLCDPSLPIPNQSYYGDIAYPIQSDYDKMIRGRNLFGVSLKK